MGSEGKIINGFERRARLQRGWFKQQWAGSTPLDAALSLVIGMLYALLVLGPEPLDPRNISWLKGDPATYYIGWALFSQSPGWHWPLTFTNRIGYPIGDSVANMDPNSLAVLALKPFSFLLPNTFQYLGPCAVLSIALQFYFGVRLFRLFFGRELWPVLFGGLLLTLTPVMTMRYLGHFALANHWLILAALYLYFAWQRGAIAVDYKLALAWCALGVAAVAVNVYLGFCVLGVLSAACLRAVLVRSSGWHRIVVLAALADFCALFSGYAIGLIRGGGGFTAGGYRYFSMNLLGLIDSQDFGAVLLRRLPRLPEQYEGYNYLGLGTLALILLLVGGSMATKWRPGWPVIEWIPLVALGVIFTALSLSTKVTLGSHTLFDLDPHDRLTPYLSVFRASGRLFWLPYYLITAGVAGALFCVFPKPAAAILGVAALIVQFADESPLRAVVRGAQLPPAQVLRSPVWQRLGEKHTNLLVFPPWQCGPEETPGGNGGFAVFGMLAATERMRTNSYYAARYSPQSLAWHCDESVKELSHLRGDSAYILSAGLATFVIANSSLPNLCHQVDGFVLCSEVTDFGLGPGIKVESPVLNAETLSFGNSTASKYLMQGWYGVEPWGVWGKGDSTLWFQIPFGPARRFSHVVLNLQLPVGRRPVTYAITNGTKEVRGTLPAGNGWRVERIAVKLPLSTAGVVNTLHFVSDPVKPVDAGLNSDPRPFGVGILSLQLVP